MTATIHRRVEALEAASADIAEPIRFILLLAMEEEIQRAECKGRHWARAAGEAQEAFKKRVTDDIGDGAGPVLVCFTSD